jgi:hypothetical protein
MVERIGASLCRDGQVYPHDDQPAVDTLGVETGIAELRDLVRADGSDFAVSGIEGGTLHLRLVIEDASCADCVMPRPFLEAVALDIVRRTAPAVDRVTIDDPREATQDQSAS